MLNDFYLSLYLSLIFSFFSICHAEENKPSEEIIKQNEAYFENRPVSKRDIVPWCDFMGAWRCRDTVVRLTPHPEARIWDHSFTSKTYQRDLKSLLNPEGG